MIPVAAILIGILTWAGNRAIPTIWKTHQARIDQRIELARELCDRGDCEALKIHALQHTKRPRGMGPPMAVPVTRIEIPNEAAGDPLIGGEPTGTISGGEPTGTISGGEP